MLKHPIKHHLIDTRIFYKMSEKNTQAGLTNNFNNLMTQWKSRGNNKPNSTVEVDVTREEKKEIMIKQFPNEVACLPNEWARSGLFSATNKLTMVAHPLDGKKERLYFLKKEIRCFSDNTKLVYTGFWLNQFDLKIYLTAIMLSKTTYLERKVNLTVYEFCQAARVPVGKKSYQLVKESLDRLFHSNLSSYLYKVVDGKKVPLREYHDHLLNHFSIDSDTGRLNIALSERLADMYLYQTTWVEWDLWNNINSEVTKALMLHICSHEAHGSNPQKIRLELLKELLGVSSPLRNFRVMIKKAMAQLLELGVVKNWKLEKDILSFVRK
jgi:hypothetical protein